MAESELHEEDRKSADGEHREVGDEERPAPVLVAQIRKAPEVAEPKGGKGWRAMVIGQPQITHKSLCMCDSVSAY